MSERNKSGSMAGLPVVSVVIATYNEAGHIEHCLNSLDEQTYPRENIEIFVVDGESPDGTAELVSSRMESDSRIRLLNNPLRIQVRAFNMAIEASSGDIVMIMSAHAVYDRRYIERCVEVQGRTGAENVGGVWETLPSGDDLIARSIATVCSVRFGIGGARFRVGGKAGYVDTVPGGAYLRRVFDIAGRMDERLVRGEDNEFNARIRKLGMKVYFDPSIRSHYFSRGSLGAFLRQSYENGMYHVLTMMVNSKGCSPRHLIPFLFVMTLLATGIGGIFGKSILAVFVATLGLYLIADIVASAEASIRFGGRQFLVLPWLFFATHFSYGFGTLVGLFRFPLRRRYWRKGLS